MYCEKYNYHLSPGNLIRVHFNLHIGRWVIAGKTAAGWRTVHNCDAVILRGARPLVSLSTLERLRAAGKRMVCARVEGLLEEYIDHCLPDHPPAGILNSDGEIPAVKTVSFNPYSGRDYFSYSDGTKFDGCRRVYFAPKLPDVKAPRGARMFQVD